jgi:hypothetical protein
MQRRSWVKVGNDNGLSRESMLRVMAVLDVISQGPRILTIVNHLTRHSDRRIASKAAMLVGRRVAERLYGVGPYPGVGTG